MMRRWIAVGRRTALPAGIQLGAIAAAHVLSFLLRFDVDAAQVPWRAVWETLPLLVAVNMTALGVFGLHRGLWRYVGILEFVQILKAATVGFMLFVPLVLLIFGGAEVPRGVFLLDWAGNVFLLSGVRLAARVASERFHLLGGPEATAGSRRLLIVGAGDAGAALCKQILNTPSARLSPTAFLDDDLRKVGNAIQGIPIVARVADIAGVVAAHRIDVAVIAMPSATSEQRREIVRLCQKAGVEFKVLPAIPDIISGAVSISSVRDVDPVDLLGRPPARLDQAAIDRFIRGRRVMITGAAGSVGSELALQVSKLAPALLLLVDQAENPLFFLEAQLQKSLAGEGLVTRIADVTDAGDMRLLMAEQRPQLVLHAAAHKHVHFMESVPAKAVRNNVGGTYALAQCARDTGVEKFVLISTDKAVRPASVMGATKRTAEMLMQALNADGPTRFVVVRFGNVLGSNASVVPIFKQQLAQGGPLTVTHPDVTRYFMSLPEAAGLVLQAAGGSEGGEIFVLDMGEPVRIVALAEMMRSLSGLKEGEVEIVFTGLRPGEKLHEELKGEGEELLETGYDKLMLLRTHPPDPSILGRVGAFLEDLPGLRDADVRRRLRELVPEYDPADRDGSIRGGA